jgi:hypothetical protein
MVINFLGYEDYLKDLEFDVIGPETFYKKCLYLRKTEDKNICRFKGIQVKLTPVLFETMFELAENPQKSHRIIIDNNENGTAPETARKRIERIRKAFLKAGITENIITQINGKYKINLDIISEDYIITSLK